MTATPKLNITLARMQLQAEQWRSVSDRRFIFLECYTLMTRNMLAAIERGEFNDNAWISLLLDRFAEYYFRALDDYEERVPTTPPVWLVAFTAATRHTTMTLQHLLLGVNAHINYDLVLALFDLLEPEWATLTEVRRAEHYADYSRVNLIIGQTIDAVQDQVIESVTPALDIVDKMLGPIDEWATAHLISRWRENVWREAIHLLETEDIARREMLRAHIEAETLRRSNMLLIV